MGLGPIRRSAGELDRYSLALAHLADAGYDRLSISQAAFFMLAAAADARGAPLTMTQLLAGFGDQLAKAVNNSYRALLEPNRRYPKAAGWLRREPNVDDERESFLVLTDSGARIIEAILTLTSRHN